MLNVLYDKSIHKIGPSVTPTLQMRKIFGTEHLGNSSNVSTWVSAGAVLES